MSGEVEEEPIVVEVVEELVKKRIKLKKLKIFF